MSEASPIPPDGSISDMSPATSTATSSSKPRRVLACVLCQHRKIKCDRNHPCSHCVKSRVECIPATQLPRQRRRRFPERVLLDRLREYEDLLRQNNIKFEPLHKESTAGNESCQMKDHNDSNDEQLKTAGANASSPWQAINFERAYGTTNIWHAMSQEFREPHNHGDSEDDDVREVDVKSVWDHMSENDNFLFGSRVTTVDISTFHPEPVQIFRLWQIYLDNVDPLLKVTHTPSLQGLIIEAASNVRNIKPRLEALMFGIYCMSISSLSSEDCQPMFNSSKKDLLTRYHFGCQQGLLNSGFLRNRDDRNSLTALFFYLLSIRSNSVPQSLSSMLAVAIRIAQRLGCHNESVLSQLNPLEAELRRRLWWSLVLYDSRMGELADSKTTILNPTWDCKILLNVSDSDFHLVMKDPPKVQGKPTEAIFTVLRSEVGNYIRNTKFYLGFNDLPIKPAAKDMQYDPTTGESELADLEKLVEEKYLKFCDPENPVHFMAIWMTRMSLAKWHLVEHWHFSGKNRSSKIGLVREATVAYALNLLECDTRLMSSPLAKGFTWMTNMYFPFPAYFQIVQNLKQRPLSQQAEHAWQIMTANYEVRFRTIIDDQIPEPFFKIFAKIILLAWEVREQAFKQMGQVITEPQIVINIRREVVKLGGNTKESEEECERTDTDMDVNNFSILAPMGFFRMAEDEYGHGYGYPGTGTGTIGTGASYTDTPGIGFVDGGISQLDWSAMDWNALNGNTPAHGTGTGTGSFPY